jgi:hypothetical protein
VIAIFIELVILILCSIELREDIERPSLHDVGDLGAGDQGLEIPTLENQLRLLDPYDHSGSSNMSRLANDDVKNAVLFSAEVLGQHGLGLLPQYGLLGSVCQNEELLPLDPRLFLNTNIPFSAFICGLQGSGKSHTMSCLLGE